MSFSRKSVLSGLSLLVFSAVAGPGLAANTYYVASGVPRYSGDVVPAAGNDGNSGLSTSLPLQTIQAAVAKANPGDTVLVRNGKYTENVFLGYDFGGTVRGRAGTSSAWITYKSENSYGAWLRPSNSEAGCFAIRSVYHTTDRTNEQWNKATNQIAYIKISDFDMQSSGIYSSGVNAFLVHDFSVVNNRIHDCGGGGIGFVASDFINITNNIVYNNCFTSADRGSGISILRSLKWSDSRTEPNYRITIERNQVYGNVIQRGTTARNGGPLFHTDGNGIIADTCPDNVSMLIQNNAIDRNGGAGIQLDGSYHVDIFNNTCYQNNADAMQDERSYQPTQRGEIALQRVTWDVDGAAAGTPQTYTEANGTVHDVHTESNHWNSINRYVRVYGNVCVPRTNYTSTYTLVDSNGVSHTYTNYAHQFYGLTVQNNTSDSSFQQNWLYRTGSTYGLLLKTVLSPSTQPWNYFPTSYNFPNTSFGSNWGDSTSLLSSDPKFVSTTNFHLTSTSPLIGKSTYSKPTVDLDSFVRGGNGLYDLGAFEFH